HGGSGLRADDAVLGGPDLALEGLDVVGAQDTVGVGANPLLDSGVGVRAKDPVDREGAGVGLGTGLTAGGTLLSGALLLLRSLLLLGSLLLLRGLLLLLLLRGLLLLLLLRGLLLLLLLLLLRGLLGRAATGHAV